MGVDGPTMNIQYVNAGWLNGATAMAPGVKQQLDAAGLDAEDYQQILGTNPFQSGSTVIDTDRFIALPESFAYEPPYSAATRRGSRLIPCKHYDDQNTATVEYSVGWTVGVTIAQIFSIGGSVTGDGHQHDNDDQHYNEMASGDGRGTVVQLHGPH